MTNDTSLTGLPLLGAGMHLSPEDGACLMEYTSVLAGERFSDNPRCTDPTLATLARFVNDATSDGGRQRLAPLAPRLTVAARTDAVGSASLVLATLLRVEEATGRSLARQVRAARRWLRFVDRHGRTGLRARLLDSVHLRGPGQRHLIAAVDATRNLPAAERDAVLRSTLEGALRSAASPQGRTPSLR
jgi:hypothetical protein